MNKINGFNPDVGTASPQLFTYKRNDTSPGGTAHLGFYPMTSFPGAGNDAVNVSKLDDDISFKLLYHPEELLYFQDGTS